MMSRCWLADALAGLYGYSDSRAIEGSPVLDRLQTVLDLGMAKGELPLDDTRSFTPSAPIVLKKNPLVSSGETNTW